MTYTRQGDKSYLKWCDTTRHINQGLFEKGYSLEFQKFCLLEENGFKFVFRKKKGEGLIQNWKRKKYSIDPNAACWVRRKLKASKERKETCKADENPEENVSNEIATS